VAGTELTFDDGPDPIWTPAVLNALREEGLRATFFVVGLRAARRPGLVEAIVADGHAVELHCHEHVRHTDLDVDALSRDTECALAVLREQGVRPTRWRPPWGVIAPGSAIVARRHGLRLERWSADPHDWRGDPADGMLAAVEPHLRPGACVLLHDGLGPGAERSGCAQTVALVRRLGPLLLARGLAQPRERQAWPVGASGKKST
jgi:peptidoglycan/xylan/chitin deacetylase (PgdA/CDA1 family)